jgi:hypothetical protein
MWGKSLIRPAVRLRLISRSLFLSLSYTALKINEMWGHRSRETLSRDVFGGAKALLDPLWDFDKFWKSIIKTAGVRRMLCGAKFVIPAGLISSN